MPQIIIIRHAKSDWSSFNSDFERGLNERGYRSCEIISRELKRRINLPDKFLVSPAKRAQLTFEEIFFATGVHPNQPSDDLKFKEIENCEVVNLENNKHELIKLKD